MLTDLAFETDLAGRFTAFGPGKGLGEQAAPMLGMEVATLLSGAAEADGICAEPLRAVIATICAESVAWHGNVRLVRPDGGSGTFRLALAPRMSGGVVIGTYGLLFDLGTPELALPGGHADQADDPGLRHDARLDPETGLWSGHAFREEISRRFDRLDVEDLPGTLLCLGFSRAARHVRTAVAMRLADELREIVRPTDLLGRISGTCIALWCDGMDHLTGGERAAKFCLQIPVILPERTAIMVGLAPRWPGSGDDPATVIEHATAALRLAEAATGPAGHGEIGGAWRVWQPD
jgi:GGDEF domain-containing protein